jgi:hypothetical protein
MGTYNWLDLTARGRQEDWDQPPGRSDGPPMSWLRRHDDYEDNSRPLEPTFRRTNSPPRRLEVPVAQATGKGIG